ncbi:ATP-binding cassette domain-containing protein [Streptomyces sp. A1499]|uniref:ABC transporter permease subunit n=1 Tax=Streptomyces sp. A1499 TaxID=2563104 RepID=UPI00109E992B|nr:ATP-binding cassette domain-containing protein [Streptomyces sp. A1499]THC51791.1 ATP-binding cassette domain-containing protein [Streptomyces sp. A1499]
MDYYLVFAVLGLGAGAVAAALGMGLVMTYKGTGFINFAHAAVALWGAFAYDELRRTGDLVVPIVLAPSHIPFGGPQPLWVALPVALTLAACLGVGMNLLVFRPLRRAPLIAKIMASLGLFTLFQMLLSQCFGSSSRAVAPVFTTRQVQVAGLSFPEDRLWMAGLVLVLAGAMALVYRYTLFGLATRALREDEAALTLSRWSPTLLATVNATAGLVLTTGVMIASASVSALNPLSVGLLVAPGLTAMLCGRLVHVVPAALTGLALGMAQGLLSFVTTKTWWPAWLSTAGVTDTLPLVIIILVLALRGHTLPTRAGIVLDALPGVPPPLRLRTLGVVGAAVAGASCFLGPALRLGVVTSMVFAMLACSLVVLVGLIGQISLGQLAVAAIAAFALAKYLDTWPFPTGLVLAGLAAAAVAVVITLPALRVRGAQLAVVTFAGAVAVQSLVLNNAQSTAVESPRIGPLDLGPQVGSDTGRLAYVLAVLAVLMAVAASVAKLIGSRTGRTFLAVRSNERAAASVGVDIVRTKTLALGISGFIAGIGGGLLAYNSQTVSPLEFDVFVGISLLVYAYIGGITGVGGALYAGALAPGGVIYVWAGSFWSSDGQSDFASVYTTLAAVGLITMAIQTPNGASDATRGGIEALRRKFRRPAEECSPTPTLPSGHVDPPVQARLTARDITVRYGGVVAVKDVSLDVGPGEIVGLIGPNGAGKTSLLDALTGFAPCEGSVELGDRTLTGKGPHRRHRAGLSRTWQSGELFDDLDAFDNVRIAGRRTGTRTRGAPADADAAWAMRLLGIEDLAARRPAQISVGQRKLVGLARALAGRPSVLLSDEPAAGLDSLESRRLGARLQSVADQGIGVVLIEHDLALVLNICDRVYVLHEGTLIAAGTPGHIRHDEGVVRAYIGTTAPISEAGV